MGHEELLKTIEEYHQNTDDNIIGVGYGYKSVNGILTDEKSIVFSVKEKIPKDQLTEDQLLPNEININDQFIKTDVVQKDFKLLGCDPKFYIWSGTTISNKNIFRPLKGGISASNITSMPNSTGTLGFIAKDNDTNSLVGVSNNHVFIDDAFICSERSSTSIISNIKNNIVTQPHESISDNHPIGVVKKYYPISSYGYNYVDVALTTINSGDTFSNNTSYKYEGLSFTNPLPFATTEEINNILIPGSSSYNPLLYSAGRTTGGKGEGITKLRISQFPSVISNIYYKKQGKYINVSYSDLIEFVATTGSTQPMHPDCPYPINRGDSGSALIADFSGVKKIIGLVFAGSYIGNDCYYGYACRIDRIASLMNISAWDGGIINFSNTNNILEHTINGLSNQVSIILSGKTYWQVGLKTI
jgi:hypothetical protein